MTRLKQEVLDKIKSDSDLFSLVAKKTGIQPISLATNIGRRPKALNQYDVVIAIAQHLGQNPEDLLEEEEMNTAKV